LNLKNPKAHQLAKELAALTGESLTVAVVHALEMRLEVERARRGGPSKAERILKFAERFSAGFPPGCRSEDHAEIYGEDGLPK
jgi:antitoxin VapB